MCDLIDEKPMEHFLQEKYIPQDKVGPTPNEERDDLTIVQWIKDMFATQDGLVLGGNDFLYTKDMSSHPCTYFLYKYGKELVQAGLDTIFLENHYIKEIIQTRGLIGHVMYCAYLYNLRVVGLEGKFTPDEYHAYTAKKIDEPWTTVAYTTKKRVDRLNIITKDIVAHHKKGKYLLFCGMSHVNDEKEVTECKGIKTLLGVPGCGIRFTEEGDTHSRVKARENFCDPTSMYTRPTDYMITLYQNKRVDKRLYIDATIWCTLHDFLFFYSSYYHLLIRHGEKPSVHRLWNHTTSIYPPSYRLYIQDMVRREPRLSIPAQDLDDVCSYTFTYFQLHPTIPSRKEYVDASSFFTESRLDEMVDKMVAWVHEVVHKKKLTRVDLDTCMNLIFLENKKLSLEEDEEKYVAYIKNKFSKQLERPEHKLFMLLRIMNAIGVPMKTNNVIERLV